MATRIVHISNSSLEVVFEGNLLKAPPLNRRGRKKWRERFFILRANRTFEFYKSKKAADAQKSPRRIVDLRECINLEVGLEYKSYQYVMCIATFKRIFFFAAPSDLVMFQWSTYLEKVKNAQDGDSIEVLDIGLRRKGGAGAVRTVRPSIVTRAFSNRSRSTVNSKQRSKSAIALMHFKGTGSTETMDLRGENSSSRGSQVSPILSPITPTSDCSFKSEDASPDEACHERFPSLSSEYSSSSHSSTMSKSGSLQFSPSRIYSSDKPPTRVRSVTSDFRTVIIPNSIPPPKDFILKKASRNKDGFFIDTSKSNDLHDSHTGSELSSTEDDKVAQTDVSVAFTAKEGRLKRTPGIKKPSPKTEKKVVIMQDDTIHSVPRKEGNSNSNFSYNDNMKRSFRYKKIDLRPPEKPLYGADDVVTDSEDEYDSENEGKGASKSCVPGPQSGRTQDTMGTLDISTDSILDESSDSVNDSKSEDENLPPRSASFASPVTRGNVLNRFKFLRQHPAGGNSAHKNVAIGNQHQPQGRHSLANTYSRVTVLGSKEESSESLDNFHVPERVPRARIRSNSQPTIALFRRNPSLIEDAEAERREEIRNTSMEAIRMRWDIDDVHSTSLPLDTDLISPSDLPARPSSEVFTELSQNSMDDLVIPPPDIFGAEAEPEIISARSETTFKLESPRAKPKLSRTQNVSKTKLFVDDKPDDREDGSSNVVSKKAVSGKSRDSVPTDEQLKSLSTYPPPPESVNRNSTDSNDTGYTSTSPGYLNSASLQRQQKRTSQSQEGTTQGGRLGQHTGTQGPESRGNAAEYRENFNAGISPDGRSTPIAQEDPRSAGVGGMALQSYSSSHSLASTSSDVSRMYVPLVFCSKRSVFGGSGGSVVRDDPNKFSVQVCLVENSDDLIRDVIGVKSLESFSQVEAEEVEGQGGVVTSEVDDFTVETSLEDLEFGFSVTNSTQKDIFSRKVRQFTYEIQNLFGSQKPFSCDVEIRYGNQQTILCIEVA